MLIKQYKSFFFNELSSTYEIGEVESFFYLILENINKIKRLDLALNIDFTFSEIEIHQWTVILQHLKEQVPIQYILGSTSFFDLDFEVNKNVLIPRPETEELVNWIIDDLKIRKFKNLKILDIGTGSGCIAISLAKNIVNTEVFALDVSHKALEIARKNAVSNNVQVAFLQQNILEMENLNQQFDVIVSNPPYVRNLEKKEIQKNVLDYEPHLALFVDDNDALLFYKKIADLALQNLSKNGFLFFEINQYLAQETAQMLQEKGFKNIEIKKDIYGNDRMIKADFS